MKKKKKSVSDPKSTHVAFCPTGVKLGLSAIRMKNCQRVGCQACTGLQGDKPTQESSPGSGDEGAVEEVWGQEAGRAPAPGWGIQSGFLGASA